MAQRRYERIDRPRVSPLAEHCRQGAVRVLLEEANERFDRAFVMRSGQRLDGSSGRDGLLEGRAQRLDATAVPDFRQRGSHEWCDPHVIGVLLQHLDQRWYGLLCSSPPKFHGAIAPLKRVR